MSSASRRTGAPMRRAPRSYLRGIVVGASLLAFAGPAPASAQAPSPDPYEVNNSPQDATAIEPETRYVATIDGPDDSDWYKIRPYEPSWNTVFGMDRKEVDISAERLTSACAARSLRITLFNAAGVEVTSAAVYPGTETSILSLRGDPEGRYDLKVDTGLDPRCAQPVRYAFGAHPYTYIPAPPAGGSDRLGSSAKPKPDQASCDVYRNKAKKASKQLKRTKKKQKKRRRQLIKSRDAFRRKAASVC